MSEQENERPERSNSDRPAWKKSEAGSDDRSGARSDRPAGRSDRSDSRSPRDNERPYSRPARDGERSSARPARDGDRPGGRPQRDGDRPRFERDRPGRAGDGRDGKPRPEWQTRVERVRPEDREKSPMIPEEITDKDLDLLVRVQMKTLSPENAERVARHLAMVNLLIDADPELAHKHALAAADRAGRIGIVRETVGLTAYTIGDFALALREMQAYRRISGKDDQLPIMVDCERGLGRPEKALELGRSVKRETLDAGVRVNLAIAMSGARLDRNENELALAELEIAELNPERVFEYSPHLFRAYADTLEILGREAEAQKWFKLADRADAALSNKNAPAVEVQDIIEELVIPEPYESRKPRESRDGGWEVRPRREYSDRPQRDSSDRPRRDGDDRPRREFPDRPRRDAGDRPQRDSSDRPRRESSDRPRRDDRDSAPREQGNGEGRVDSTGAPQVLRFGNDKPGWKKPSGK